MSVVVAYLHREDLAATFHECILRLTAYDAAGPRMIAGRLAVQGVASRIGDNRNDIAALFLDRSDADWLWFVDSDMAFSPQIVERLVSVADPVERPVVGGLCFAQRGLGQHPEFGTPVSEVYPTIFMWDPEDRIYMAVPTYPADQLVRCAGTGAACLLIHRSALEKIRAKEGDNWFTPVPWVGEDRITKFTFSEDMSFCGRLSQHGVPLHVHTGIRTQHAKTVHLDEDMWLRQEGLDRRERWVVIPTKNNLAQLRDLIGQLRDQGETDGIVVVDNGVGRTARNWLGSQKDLTVVEMPGAGIHHMWNAGAEIALRNVPCDIVFLNDDLAIGPNFISGLCDELSDRVGLVCPNYDNRPGTGLVPVDQICANRYDGTGGLAGFAFAVPAEVFARGYRFPEDCMWWYGDNDLLLHVTHQLGLTAGIVTGTTVEHLDGGGQTGSWDAPEIQPQLEADRAAFMARWISPTT